MKKIAFLGLGEMGSRMCKHLIEAGNEVNVWNRTRSKANPAIALGAHWSDSPRSAAQGADIIISMVRDDEASDFVWLDDHQGALKSMHEHAIAVECSTLSAHHMRHFGTAFSTLEKTLINAPVAGSLPQAEQKRLIFLVGAPENIFNNIKPVLTQMGGAVHHVGEDESGTVLKLMVNSLLGAQLSLFSELIAYAKLMGLDEQRVQTILSQTPVVSPALAIASQAMVDKNFHPSFPINLVEKDFRLLL